jgi:hypothetical protein
VRAKHGNPVCVRPLPGKPTVRKAQLLGGQRMTREANAGGGNAAGNYDQQVSALLLMVVGNRSDTGPGARARKRGDAVR